MAVLECKALTKNYGHLAALDGVDFAIEPGRIVGLLGPNGSGKTTLIKLANGLLTPTSGDILVCGMAPGNANLPFGTKIYRVRRSFTIRNTRAF